MRLHRTLVPVALVLAGGLAAFSPGAARAQQYPTFGKVSFAEQSVKPARLTAAVHMTKELATPVRAFGGPTFMLAHPDNPRVIVAATTDLRTRVCYLLVSRDAGGTWKFSESLPTPEGYPYCMDNVAGLAAGALAWGRDGTLYYSAQAYGDDEGGFGNRNGRVSQFLSRTTDLGDTWTKTLVVDYRGFPAPEPPPATYGTAVAVDTSGPTDVVFVGYNVHYNNPAPGGTALPPDSPLRNGPIMISVSTDGGDTFAEPVNLQSLSTVTQMIQGTAYPIMHEGFFGGPLVFAHDGVVLAISGGQPPANKLPPNTTSAFGASFSYPMPQMLARSTDQGKTWDVSTLGPPIFSGAGSQTGIGWTPRGGPDGTFVVAYQGTPETSASSGPAQIVMQRSTDRGVTWTEPLAIDEGYQDGSIHNSFYPQLNVAPNGRIDVVWQDDIDQSDFHYNVRYTYSTDGGLTWAPNMLITDRPIDFNLGVSFNSDLRMPPGVASTDEYAVIGWADTRNANDLTQTQDTYSAAVQFDALPTTDNTTLPYVAAVFAGLVAAGVALLGVQFARRRR